MKKIAIFASGTGSNAQKIIEGPFRTSPASCWGGEKKRPFEVALIVSNKPDAGVLKIARAHHIPSLIIEKEKFFRSNVYVELLKEKPIDLIVLAGFLWKIPDSLIKAFPNSIINIHPALLPKYGGKGMYGDKVHQAVIKSGDEESGITIHYVDEHYDNGDIIFQVKCPVMASDTAESLAARIHQLEYANYPKVIEELLTK